MKTLCAGLIVLFASLVCLAQSDTRQEPNWQPFAPDKEEFSTEVPTVLSPRIAVRGITRSYRGRLNNTWFFAFSDIIASPSSTKIALNFVRATQPTGTQEKFGDMPSEKFEFADDEGFYHRLFTFKTNTRIYVLQTVSSEMDDPLAERFFAKLQIGKIQPADPSIPQNAVSEPPKINFESRLEQLLSGRGSGSGGGIGTGSDQPEVRPTTAPLLILVKPRPRYTDLARFYGIIGAVRTKVTFSQNGTISSVQPITRLPFGLTKSALNAAKSIQFSPALREGKAVDTTKLVEFQFNIY